MRHPALFLLAAAVLMGCICDIPKDGAVMLQYRRLFESGRHAEQDGNVKIAEDTYGWLIGRDSLYGEYGLAMLQLHRDPDSHKAVMYLLSCAKRSRGTSKWFMNTEIMDSAFSAAAMAQLADIAISNHNRPDVAASLHCMITDLVTPQVKAWVEEMKANADSEMIYRDVISAVESNCKNHENTTKVLKWSEISEVFLMNGVTE